MGWEWTASISVIHRPSERRFICWRFRKFRCRFCFLLIISGLPRSKVQRIQSVDLSMTNSLTFIVSVAITYIHILVLNKLRDWLFLARPKFKLHQLVRIRFRVLNGSGCWLFRCSYIVFTGKAIPYRAFSSPFVIDIGWRVRINHHARLQILLQIVRRRKNNDLVLSKIFVDEVRYMSFLTKTSYK